jgi:hypothetical protein
VNAIRYTTVLLLNEEPLHPTKVQQRHGAGPIELQPQVLGFPIGESAMNKSNETFD